MLYLLAETEREQALAEGYLLLFGIALAGLIGVLVLLGIFLIRRSTRQRLIAIEQDKAERRKAKSAGRVDAWSAGADRYVDHDKLPDDLPYDTQPDPANNEPNAEEADPDEDEPEDAPPGWGEQDPDEEQDPYGLFDDKPYREQDEEPDEESAEDDEDEDDWDEDTDPDERP